MFAYAGDPVFQKGAYLANRTNVKYSGTTVRGNSLQHFVEEFITHCIHVYVFDEVLFLSYVLFTEKLEGTSVFLKSLSRPLIEH